MQVKENEVGRRSTRRSLGKLRHFLRGEYAIENSNLIQSTLPIGVVVAAPAKETLPQPTHAACRNFGFKLRQAVQEATHLPTIPHQHHMLPLPARDLSLASDDFIPVSSVNEDQPSSLRTLAGDSEVIAVVAERMIVLPGKQPATDPARF